MLKLPYNYTSAFIDQEDSVYAYKASEFFNPTVLQNLKEAKDEDAGRVVYKVKSGDYLGRIASRYHVTVNQIKQWNHLRSNNLRVGQTLVIYSRGHAPKPQGDKPSQPKSSQDQAPKTTGGTTYTVKSGDTLYDIAKKFPGVSAKDIMSHNGMKNASIRPGMKLKIPAAK